MRILAIPAAILLACCIYMPLPAVREFFLRLTVRGYDLTLRLFTRRDGHTDDAPALAVYLLALGGAFALLGAIHPLVSMLLMAPVFTAPAVLPGCARIKDELDSGKYARDIPAYEALVRDTCVSLAPAFIQGLIAPMILCALGMPLHLGAAFGAVYTAVSALAQRLPRCARAADLIRRTGERVFIAMILLCSGAVGRNPLRTRGAGASGRLLSVLGISEDGTQTHAPMAGDIAQGIFLCGFASLILCFVLCAVGFVLCR